jgi:hypothetical protein
MFILESSGRKDGIIPEEKSIKFRLGDLIVTDDASIAHELNELRWVCIRSWALDWVVQRFRILSLILSLKPLKQRLRRSFLDSRTVLHLVLTG